MFKEKLNKIFKAYDIRGIYPGELDEETAYEVGRAFVLFLKKGKKDSARKLNIVVAQDNRPSSDSLKKEIVRGIIGSGADVIDIGLSMTPMFYFAVAFYNFDGGIIITASHNPPEYNGFKCVREKAIPITSGSGMEEIKEIILSPKKEEKRKGEAVRKEVISDYMDFIFKGFDLNKIQHKTIVVDTANAVPGIVVSEVFGKRLKTKFYHLFSELDSNFPNHLPNPLIKENLKFLQKGVLEKKADLGIAFDGDGDRITFVDEKGEIVSGSMPTALLAKILLKEKKGEKILYDVRSSSAVRETIEECGGIPIVSRLGHSFIKEKMRKENILFGGEVAGHYYSKDNYFFDAPFFVIFKILEEMSTAGKTISELLKPFKKYFYSDEMNFSVADKDKKIKELEEIYGKGIISYIDGVRVDFEDWWFLVRKSQSEPLLRLIIEAKTPALLEQKQKEIIDVINR